MEPLTLVLIVAVAVLGAVVVVLLVRQGFGGPTAAPPQTWPEPRAGEGHIVVLDLSIPDPSRPAVQRLVRDVGERVLATHAELSDVEVRDREGTVLGHVHRPDPLPPSVTLGREPPRRGAHHPNPTGGSTPPPVDHQGSGVDLLVPERTFADRFQLPEPVRVHLRDPDRPIDVVRAILTAAGHDPRLEGEVLISGDTGVVVANVRDGDPNEILNHAYLRVRDSGVDRGVVLRLGWVNPEYVRYREYAAPHVRHVGPDAVQRMADAVELAVDPFVLALGAPVLR